MTITRLAFAAVVAGSAALAGPITWTVNATLSDGATVTGSFVFDPDLGYHDPRPTQIITNFKHQRQCGNARYLFRTRRPQPADECLLSFRLYSSRTVSDWVILLPSPTVPLGFPRTPPSQITTLPLFSWFLMLFLFHRSPTSAAPSSTTATST
jgi:hypothetical protein